jgi:hypothetical protein
VRSALPIFRRNEPSYLFRSAEKHSPESNRGQRSQPITAHERRRLAIANECVILDSSWTYESVANHNHLQTRPSLSAVKILLQFREHGDQFGPTIQPRRSNLPKRRTGIVDLMVSLSRSDLDQTSGRAGCAMTAVRAWVIPETGHKTFGPKCRGTSAACSNRPCRMCRRWRSSDCTIDLLRRYRVRPKVLAKEETKSATSIIFNV